MKKIQLTRGLVALIDDCDYDFVSHFSWHAHKVGNNFYAVTTIHVKGKTGILYMHREIMGDPEGYLIDHIDHNGLNNVRSNLRLATKQQNAINSTKIFGKVPLKGVIISRGAIIARIKKDGKMMQIGTYKTIEDAGRAYDAKAIELFGEFATVNFPNNCGIINNRIRDNFPSPI